MEALLADLVAPGVLHPPAPRLAVDEVHARQAHGVGERRLARHQPLRLGHGQLDAVQALVVVQGGVPDPGVLVALLGHVAGEPHRLAVADGRDRRRLEHGQFGGDVLLGGLAHHEVGAVDAEPGVEGDLGARVVRHHDELLQAGRVAIGELARGQRPDAVEGLVLVPVLPHELARRGAQVDGEHPVDVLHRRRADRLGVRAVGHGRAQAQGGPAQRRGQVVVHGVGVRGRVRVRHGVVRRHPVLGDEPGELRPPAAVADRLLQGLDHLPVAQRPLGVGDGPGQEGGGLLQLVVEVDEALAQLHRLHVQLLDEAGAQDVEAGEGPAAPRVLLVGDGGVGDEVGDRGVDRGDDGAVQGELLDAGGGHGVAREAGGGVGEEGGVAGGDPGGVDGVGLGHGARVAPRAAR